MKDCLNKFGRIHRMQAMISKILNLDIVHVCNYMRVVYVVEIMKWNVDHNHD